jgi:gluconolactonase
MERALELPGYEVRHVYGEGGHNGTMGAAVFPDALRWLWKGWPQPVAGGRSANAVLQQVILPGEGWELVGEGYGFTEGTAADAAGNVYFQDIPASKTYRVAAAGGRPELVSSGAQRASGTCIGADGSRYEVAGGSKQVLKYEVGGAVKVIGDGIAGNDLVVAHNGNVYVTAPDGSERPGKIWLIRPGRQPVVVDSGLKFVNGLCLTPDQTQLYVAESAGHWIWVFSVLPDGTLANKQRFGWLHVPDDKENAWPDGLKCDRNGLIYVATNMGIQVLDQLGRVNAILPMPPGGQQPSNLCFGGKDFDVLYVSAVGKVWRRKLKTRGCNPFEMPVRAPMAHL